MIWLFFLLLPPANMERQQTMPELAKIDSSWLIWHFSCLFVYLFVYYYYYLFAILKFTFQCPPILGRIESACHADISQDIFQLLLISRLCWHHFFPISLCHLNSFSFFFFFSKSTNKFFCKKLSLIYPPFFADYLPWAFPQQLPVSSIYQLAQVKLLDFLSFQTCTSNQPGHSKQGKEVMVKTIKRIHIEI